MKIFICSLLAISFLQSQQISPQEIAQQLQAAEMQFNKALEMFNPWYTGPLLTPSATLMPLGQGNFQPYFFFTDQFASYNEDRKSVSLKDHLLTLNQANYLQFGVTDTMDGLIILNEQVSWQSGQTGGGFGDMSLGVGFPILTEKRYTPKIKFSIVETFPTGKFDNLSTNGLGLNATGTGAYATQFSLGFGKLLFWATKHPLNTRLFLGYKMYSTTFVHNFNTFGGGFGTKGTVLPGSVFSADLGMELSLSQQWVLTTDVVYQSFNRTKFHGFPGTTTKEGSTPATVGNGSQDQLSIAPALEYNWSGNLGILAGVQFTVYGRNSSNFASGILTLSWSFP